MLFSILEISNVDITILECEFSEAVADVEVPLSFVLISILEQSSTKSLLYPFLLFTFIVVTSIVIEIFDKVRWNNSLIAQTAKTFILILEGKFAH